VSKFDELYQGGEQHGSEAAGIKYVSAGPYLLVDRKFESPGHTGYPEHQTRYEKISHHRFGFAFELYVLSREKPKDNLGDGRQGGSDAFGIESGSFTVVHMTIAEYQPVEMRTPEAFQRIGIDAAIGRGISAEARDYPIAKQNEHGNIGSAAGLKKVEDEGGNGVGDADALQHAEDAQFVK